MTLKNTYQWSMTLNQLIRLGRVALERIQIFPIFGEEKNWPKFSKF